MGKIAGSSDFASSKRTNGMSACIHKSSFGSPDAHFIMKLLEPSRINLGFIDDVTATRVTSI